jgi:hypothetical protein
MAYPKGHKVPIMLAPIACAATIAACGSSKSSSTAAASGQFAQGVKYSDCMRSHGVSNFPDPAPGGGFDIPPQSAVGAEEGSPAFVSAQTACAKLQPGGSAPPRITGEQVHQMFLEARCIRQHGFPHFPDPSLGSGLIPPDWNNEAPASITARKSCAHVGIAIPGWGVVWFGPV